MTDPDVLSLAERLEDWAANPRTADGVGYIMEQAAAELRSLVAELEDERQASQESYDERMAEIESLQAENDRLSSPPKPYSSMKALALEIVEEENDALRERLAATEAVAKRFRDGWRDAEWHNWWRQHCSPSSPTPAREVMTDAERQVLDRLNEPSDDD